MIDKMHIYLFSEENFFPAQNVFGIFGEEIGDSDALFVTAFLNAMGGSKRIRTNKSL